LPQRNHGDGTKDEFPGVRISGNLRKLKLNPAGNPIGLIKARKQNCGRIYESAVNDISRGFDRLSAMA
jgi:hypothetical protein